MSRIIVLVPDGYSVGFLVDGIREIAYVAVEEGTGNPMEGDAFKNRYVERVASLSGDLVNILNVDRMLDDLENYFTGG